MIQDNEYFTNYLEHLSLRKEKPSLSYLNRLVKSQLIKFPFENISKLILHFENKLTSLVDSETHLSNSIQLGAGGTCYACNYYFNRLLKFLGFEAEIHGANMGEAKDVHVVNIVSIGGEKFLVDVGYGAPFYEALNLSEDKSEILTGEMKYIISPRNDNPAVEVFKKGEKVHEYIVNKKERSINYFAKVIEASFGEEAGFMNKLRIVKFFDRYYIELKDLRVTIHRDKSISRELSGIDELENVLSSEFSLPKLPIRKAFTLIEQKLKQRGKTF